MPLAARRIVFFTLLAATAGGLGWLMVLVLAPGGWTVVKALILLAFLGIVPWLGICVGNTLPGLVLRLACRDPARRILPAPAPGGPVPGRIALALTVRNEDLAPILPPLLALLDTLGDDFTLFVLSDTQEPGLVAAEDAVIAAHTHPRLRIRRRADNAGFKAGNVMDFLDHHAAGFTYAVMLDADSTLSAEAVRWLVAIIAADPRMAIVQHLTVGRPAREAFPRLFQFGMRAGMRIWATGQGWWQAGDGPYWGHNAILRIDAFRAHARLPALPDGSAILSHDQMEAALLCGAGYRVCVWADEEGSAEANPPALPEFLHRDARWLEGNLQYRHLLTLPGLRWMGRWQLVQAMLLFAGAPLYTAILVLAALNAALGGAADVPRGALLALALAWTAALYAPKLAGYAEVLLRDPARYGGRPALMRGAAAEFAFTLLLDALSQPHKTGAMLRLALGRRAGWLPQNRAARGVGWGEAARLFWPHTLFGLLVFTGFAAGSWAAVAWALPFAGGLLLAIPFCVVTADPRFSAWLARRGFAAIPEELDTSAPRGRTSDIHGER